MAGGGGDAPLLALNSLLFGAATHTSFENVSWKVGPEKVALIPFLPLPPPPSGTVTELLK